MERNYWTRYEKHGYPEWVFRIDRVVGEACEYERGRDTLSLVRYQDRTDSTPKVWVANLGGRMLRMEPYETLDNAVEAIEKAVIKNAKEIIEKLC